MQTRGIVAISSESGGRVDGPRRTERWRGCGSSGASASYFRIRDMNVEQGARLLRAGGGSRGVPVVVIGKDVAENLFEAPNPLGRPCASRASPTAVIGVLEKQGSLFGMSMDNVVIAPGAARR